MASRFLRGLFRRASDDTAAGVLVIKNAGSDATAAAFARWLRAVEALEAFAGAKRRPNRTGLPEFRRLRDAEQSSWAELRQRLGREPR